MNRCKNCGKPIGDKAIYCTDRCRMAFKRAKLEPEQSEQNVNPNTNKPEQIDPEQPNPNKSNNDLPKLTRTDKTFYDRAIRDNLGGYRIRPEDYYYFTAERLERECKQCGKKFITSLRDNQYCSYAHLAEALSGAVK